MITPESLADQFANVFGDSPPTVWARAPGRVCLLGEHTDYNDGFVLPMAIEPSVYVVARPRADDRFVVRSAAMDATIALSGAAIRSAATDTVPFEPHWTNYVFGVAALLTRRGIRLQPADLLIESDVPVGGGVSSSAALEVATALALLALSGDTLPDVELALLARQAEHTFAGSPCGILDPFASLLSRAGHALLLDCRSQAFEHIAFSLPSCVIAVIDSRTKHDLGRSEYPVRQAQCRAGVEALARRRPGIAALRDVAPADLDDCAAAIDPQILRRCRHVVTENDRLQRAVAALRRGEAAECGALMTASHASLRDDYEVSCAELDALVEVAAGVDGVYGAKMTGGGFGGCVVALLESAAVADLCAAIHERYDRRFQQPASVIVTQPAAGAEVRTP